jgi:hypothetical protein
MSKETIEKSKELLQKLNDRDRSWAERNGALIFLIIVWGLIGLFVLFDAVI